MTDDTNQNSGSYTGFAGWGVPQAGGPTPPTPPPPANNQGTGQTSQQVYYNYGQPAQTQPVQVQPAQAMPQPMQMPQPAQAAQQPAQTAPMAGMMDPSQTAGDPNYMFGTGMKDFTTSIKLPAHSLSFDEAYFLKLLAGSISLSKDEKKKIIDSIPKLRQQQVDELIRIFEEERTKFVELSPKHSTQLKKLEAEHRADWLDLEMEYTAESKKQEEQNKADAIRKQLGI